MNKFILIATMTVLWGGTCCWTMAMDEAPGHVRNARSSVSSTRRLELQSLARRFGFSLSGSSQRRSSSRRRLDTDSNVRRWCEQCLNGADQQSLGAAPVQNEPQTPLHSRWSIASRAGFSAGIGGSSSSNRDYIFVLDTSGSVSSESFEKAKQSVAQLFESFCPLAMNDPVVPTKQVAVVLFSTTSETVLRFNDSKQLGLQGVKDRILSLEKKGGYTATADALRFVREEVLPTREDRSATLDVIVVTDGRCNTGCKPLRLLEEAENLRPRADILAFGIDNYRLCEIQMISGFTPGTTELQNFDEFPAFAEEFAKVARSKPGNCY